MDEYIKRGDALRAFTVAPDGTRYRDYDCDNFPSTVQLRTVKKMLREVPAADVAPIKRGEWENKRVGMIAVTATCQNCKAFVTWDADGEDFSGCPYCLTDMRSAAHA